MSYASHVRAAAGASLGVIGSLPNVISTTPANASITLATDGTYSTSTGGSGSWVTPNSKASAWEVMATVTSGTLSSGTTGSWLDFSSSRTWAKNVVGQVLLQLEFRDATTQIVRATRNITIEES